MGLVDEGQVAEQVGEGGGPQLSVQPLVVVEDLTEQLRVPLGHVQVVGQL